MRFVIAACLVALAAPAFAAEDALAEVNATRARLGLPPFAPDPQLHVAAARCAEWRAANRVEGHTPDDFAALPRGVHADAGGCAAWPRGMGWGACCTYDRYRTAGAAYAIGPDGRRYMHLFVRR